MVFLAEFLEISDYSVRHLLRYFGQFHKVFLTCRGYLRNGLELLHKCFLTRRSDSRDLIQKRLGLVLGSKRFVILYGESVCLVLNPGYQLKSFGMCIDWQLYIVKIQSPGPVVVVLDHAANRYIKSQSIQDLKCDIYLTSSAVHKKEIGEM